MKIDFLFGLLAVLALFCVSPTMARKKKKGQSKSKCERYHGMPLDVCNDLKKTCKDLTWVGLCPQKDGHGGCQKRGDCTFMNCQGTCERNPGCAWRGNKCVTSCNCNMQPLLDWNPYTANQTFAVKKQACGATLTQGNPYEQAMDPGGIFSWSVGYVDFPENTGNHTVTFRMEKGYNIGISVSFLQVYYCLLNSDPRCDYTELIKSLTIASNTIVIGGFVGVDQPYDLADGLMDLLLSGFNIMDGDEIQIIVQTTANDWRVFSFLNGIRLHEQGMSNPSTGRGGLIFANANRDIYHPFQLGMVCS